MVEKRTWDTWDGWLVGGGLSLAPTCLSDPFAITLHCDQHEGGGVWSGCVVVAVKAMRWGRGPAVVVLNRQGLPLTLISVSHTSTHCEPVYLALSI